MSKQEIQEELEKQRRNRRRAPSLLEPGTLPEIRNDIITPTCNTPPSATDDSDEGVELECDCETPDLALDEGDIGPATVQILWCDQCESVLTTIVQEVER